MDVKQILKEYIKTRRMTIQKFADEVGCSRGVISDYLRDTYKGNIQNTEDKIKTFLQREGFFGAAEEEADNIEGIFLTNDVKGIIGVCGSCQLEQVAGVVLGRSGYGKTYALQHYAKKPNVIYMECDELMTASDMVTYLEDLLDLPGKGIGIWPRINRVRDFFRSRHNQGYLLIFDEADKLFNQRTQKKLEIVRKIYDQSRVGIVVAGEPQLKDQLKRFSTQFANRIQPAVKLEGLGKADVERYLSKYNVTDEARDEIVRIAINKENGCFRKLDGTIKNILRVCDDDRITIDTVEKATRMML